MEYCGAGSVSDIIRLRNKTVRTLLNAINGKQEWWLRKLSSTFSAFGAILMRCSVSETTTGCHCNVGPLFP